MLHSVPMESVLRDDLILSIGPFAVHAGVWRGGDRGRLLLLHGLGGNSLTWDRAGALLAAQLSCLAVAIDCPGFGPTHPRQKTVSIASLLEVVRAVMAEFDDHRPWTILGNSLGGFLAIQAARQWSHRVQSLVLAGSAWPLIWGRTPRQLARLASYWPALVPHLGRRLIARHNRRTGLPGVVDNPVQALFHDPERLDSELRERLLAVSAERLTWVKEASRAYEQTIRDLAGHLLHPGLLRGVVCPALVIHGRSDSLFPEAALDPLRRMYPDWHYVVMSDVGHVPQMEVPKRFAASAGPFIDAAWAGSSERLI